jgi:hypothetical protein
MRTKIDDCKIKYRDIFLDHDNLIESETKPIMKLNSQLTKYLWMKSRIKLNKKRLNSTDLQIKLTS